MRGELQRLAGRLFGRPALDPSETQTARHHASWDVCDRLAPSLTLEAIEAVLRCPAGFLDRLELERRDLQLKEASLLREPRPEDEAAEYEMAADFHLMCGVTAFYQDFTRRVLPSTPGETDGGVDD